MATDDLLLTNPSHDRVAEPRFHVHFSCSAAYRDIKAMFDQFVSAGGLASMSSRFFLPLEQWVKPFVDKFSPDRLGIDRTSL